MHTLVLDAHHEPRAVTSLTPARVVVTDGTTGAAAQDVAGGRLLSVGRRGVQRRVNACRRDRPAASPFQVCGTATEGFPEWVRSA